MALYWMSFCDGSRPAGQQFCGVAIVEADDLRDAVRVAWETGCNPGGQIASVEIPPERLTGLENVPRNTLMDRTALESYDLI